MPGPGVRCAPVGGSVSAPRPPGRSRAVAALALAGLCALASLPAATSAAGEAVDERSASSLGVLAPRLEGTWELVSLSLPGGVRLEPPTATGVVVVDGPTYFSAAYVLAGPGRKVGGLWQGRLEVVGSHFRVVPETGLRYDDAEDPPARAEVPPPSEGTVAVERDAVVFVRDDGGRVEWRWAEQRRIQVEADGTRIEHRRTSLRPRVPDGLPGR